MVSIHDLVARCDALLQPELFNDYCPNGLQIQGKTNIRRLITGVTASQALIDAAIAQQADAILVHHGFFWKNEPAVLTGMKRQRIAALLAHGINLVVYHLPLDAHASLGNNIQLAQRLKLNNPVRLDEASPTGLIFRGQLPEPMPAAVFAEHLQATLGRPPLHIAPADAQQPIKTLAWCTGAAQAWIDLAAQAGVDAYMTGEASEASTHAARELGIHFYAAGHHATERYGVQALGEHLAQQTGLEHTYIEIDNPV